MRRASLIRAGADQSIRAGADRPILATVWPVAAEPPPDDAPAGLGWDTPWRVRIIAALAFTIVALVATARAGEREREHARRASHREASESPRALLARQLADEAASIDRALVTVNERLAAIEPARVRRLGAAYRVLRADPDDAMATARRRAAVRVVIERDATERKLLVEEAARLRDAADRTGKDATRIPELELPPPIDRPARGAIVRRFGTLQHDRSRATLSRRGVDFEVELHAQVVAPADGVVRYAGPIRGLDTGVILDHGSYVTVIGKLGEVAVPVGAPVSRGDRLGRADRHRVYLELRVKLGPGGRPLDPESALNHADAPAPHAHSRSSTKPQNRAAPR